MLLQKAPLSEEVQNYNCRWNWAGVHFLAGPYCWGAVVQCMLRGELCGTTTMGTILQGLQLVGVLLGARWLVLSQWSEGWTAGNSVQFISITESNVNVASHSFNSRWLPGLMSQGNLGQIYLHEIPKGPHPWSLSVQGIHTNWADTVGSISHF